MHILFPITYQCNLDCAFCCSKALKKTAIDINKSVQAIKDNKSRIDWVYITGGEPFLLDNLFEVCQDLRDYGFKVGVTTNGTIFRHEIAFYVDRIGISLDGPKKYHDRYRGEGTFNKALSLFHAVKGKCETVIMSVAFKDNIEELTRLKPVVEELSPTYWQIQRDTNDYSVVIPKL
jgi:MoaA/NifB/PqqE/SkfB family radical SAM enzyme